VAQGGDWGAVIVDLMGAKAPSGLLGIHTNMPGVIPPEQIFKTEILRFLFLIKI
jgi:hypothetical protein